MVVKNSLNIVYKHKHSTEQATTMKRQGLVFKINVHFCAISEN